MLQPVPRGAFAGLSYGSADHLWSGRGVSTWATTGSPGLWKGSGERQADVDAIPQQARRGGPARDLSSLPQQALSSRDRGPLITSQPCGTVSLGCRLGAQSWERRFLVPCRLHPPQSVVGGRWQCPQAPLGRSLCCARCCPAPASRPTPHSWAFGQALVSRRPNSVLARGERAAGRAAPPAAPPPRCCQSSPCIQHAASHRARSSLPP